MRHKRKQSKADFKYIKSQRSLSSIELKLKMAEDLLSKSNFTKMIQAVTQYRNSTDVKTRELRKPRKKLKKPKKRIS